MKFIIRRQTSQPKSGGEWGTTAQLSTLPLIQGLRGREPRVEGAVSLPMASSVWIVRYLWLIPVLPLLAAGIGALLKREQRRFAAGIAITSISLSFVLAMVAFVHLLGQPERIFINFPWMQFGSEWVKLGWMLDPLAAVMLVMVTFVGLLIFIYSVAYMHHDENFTRFFCFLSLFAGAMLGLLIANSLLLLFMCWEVVGLTSYLLIGFWYERPAAAAAAKKAFITTRIGDLGLLLGMVWLYGQTGTLLFYDHGAGCMEHPALSLLATQATGIALLIFCGAVGKSGQLPLHVWLPDAMEGPTPVSALIHAATMVAAGVYLVARVYPLMSVPGSAALQVVAWVGALTAIFAAVVAVAQDDIKRILAYSTVSQLGYMMIGLGVGGVAVGVFHLIAHAFFKALLFLGAGSVIHGCMGEQDIREMGGLRKWMPVTFATYAVGTLALCGFPLFFSGFWSKDAILHAAYEWNGSRVPFYLGSIGALLTAFYMTRQVCYVFFGKRRKDPTPDPIAPSEAAVSDPHDAAHESPAAMTYTAGAAGDLRGPAGLHRNSSMAVVASLSGAEVCRPGLPATDGERIAAADAGFVLACLRRLRAGLVDVWAQADQASCRSRMLWSGCSRRSFTRCGKACTSTSFTR